MEAEQLKAKVRVLCWVMTNPKNHEKKARHIKATWARRCNKLVFISSEEGEVMMWHLKSTLNNSKFL